MFFSAVKPVALLRVSGPQPKVIEVLGPLQVSARYRGGLSGPDSHSVNALGAAFGAGGGRPFTLEGNSITMQATHEMLLQSWSATSGVPHSGAIRLFPATPWRWHAGLVHRPPPLNNPRPDGAGGI